MSGYPSLVWSWPAKNYVCRESVLFELGGSNPPPDAISFHVFIQLIIQFSHHSTEKQHFYSYPD